MSALPVDWQRWIAENVLLQNDHQDLVRILVKHGFDEELVRREVGAAADHPYIKAARSLARQLKKRDWLLETYRTLEASSVNPPGIERRERLSRAEFFSQHYARNQPVIITGALAHWNALSVWTPDYLKRQAGDQTVEIQARRTSDAHYEINSAQHKTLIRFADYIDLVETAGSTNDCYMTATNKDRNQQALSALWRDLGPLPHYLKDDPANPGFFWLGPAGTVTPLHHDLTNNFMAQVRGRKLIRLISPDFLPCIYNHLHCYSQVDLDNIDYARFPLFKNVKVIEFILEPGELLFLPVGWWHYVRGLDVTITMTFTNFHADNDFASFYQTFSQI